MDPKTGRRKTTYYNRRETEEDTDTLGVKILRGLAVSSMVWFLGFGFMVLFSGGWGGWGAEIFLFLSGFRSFFLYVAVASICLTFCLTILDVTFWPAGPMKILGKILVGLNLSGYLLAALFFTRDFPAGMLCFYSCACGTTSYLLYSYILIS